MISEWYSVISEPFKGKSIINSTTLSKDQTLDDVLKCLACKVAKGQFITKKPAKIAVT